MNHKIRRLPKRHSIVLATIVLSQTFCGLALGSSSASAIPHSTIASAVGQGINSAMLSCPTTRYAHGVLGDDIEAGCLVLLDEKGRQYLVELPSSQVFEDLLPRIADVDNDGSNDVVVVRSDTRGGAALVIYGLKGHRAVELAATPTIGRTYRWLAPIGIADFNDDGRPDIAYVQTPHIGGILKIWSIINGKFEQIAERPGFSNHSIGSTRVSTSRIVDHNGDGVPDIALPDQYRGRILWVTLVPDLAVIDESPYELDYFD